MNTLSSKYNNIVKINFAKYYINNIFNNYQYSYNNIFNIINDYYDSILCLDCENKDFIWQCEICNLYLCDYCMDNMPYKDCYRGHFKKIKKKINSENIILNFLNKMRFREEIKSWENRDKMKKMFAKNSINSCDFCYKNICYKCKFKCYNCRLNICKKHNVVICCVCNENICKECIYGKCNVCNKLCCDKCIISKRCYKCYYADDDIIIFN